MNLAYNESIILNVMKRRPDLGKTALMKIVYMLQQVKKIDLGYDFEIYTYGPYSSEVLESVDALTENNLVCSEMYPYGNYIGYRLNISSEGEKALFELSPKDEKSVNDILDFSNGKSAKDLELLSTIIFISNLYLKNKLSNERNQVIKKVHEIKPHFDEDTISATYDTLKRKDYIKA